MIQEIGKNRYHNEYKNTTPKPDSIALGYRGRELLMRERDGELSFLRFREAEELLDTDRANMVNTGFPGIGPSVYLFSIDGTEYFWLPGLKDLELSDRAEQESFSGPGGTETAPTDTKTASAGTEIGLCWRTVDSLRADCPRETAFAGVTGYQLASWYESRRFCPRCAHAMVHDEQERMMRCPECGLQEYPKISPAVIVAITNGEKLLLTRYAGRSYKKYALVAGFAEIGETIEETVAREVMEETGLRVKNLRYYKSQPWSFSGTLLMGFFAELDGPEEITLDEHELAEAFWCPRENVPEDDGVSLTREMMRVFRDGIV